MIRDLYALRSGAAIDCPVYDYSIYDRTDRTVTIVPSRVIIVEGILIFPVTLPYLLSPFFRTPLIRQV